MAVAKVLPLYHGSLELDSAWIRFGPPYQAPAIVTRSQRNARSPLCQVPVQTFVIDHPEGRILFDAGIRSDWESAWPHAYREIAWYDGADPDVYFEHVLKAAGHGPEDFRYVFISHLHADHAGGLSLFQNTGVPVLVHEEELKSALRLEQDEEFYIRGDYDLSGIAWTPIYGDREILSSVEVIETPGHTRGSMALSVETVRGRLILASDACLDLPGYGPPAVSSISNLSHEDYLISVEKIRARAFATNARVVFGHDCDCAVHEHGTVGREPLRYWPNGGY